MLPSRVNHESSVNRIIGTVLAGAANEIPLLVALSCFRSMQLVMVHKLLTDDPPDSPMEHVFCSCKAAGAGHRLSSSVN
jgi:hypothetical protein